MRAKHADSRIDNVINKAASGVHGAVERAADVSHYANHRLHNTAQRLHRKEQQWVATSGDYVQRHPLLIVGCAVAAGFVLSKLFQRRPTTDYSSRYPEE